MIGQLGAIPDAVLAAVRDELRLGINATRFWRAVVDYHGPSKGAAQRIVHGLGWRYGTTNSRFTRAGLPSPAEYVDGVRMVYAAHLFGRNDDRVETVAFLLGYASAQSFGRHVKKSRGMTAAEFRDVFPYAAALESFLNLRVRPYRDIWETFNPVPRRTVARRLAVAL